MKQPELSIIIPAYNEAKRLKKTLPKVLDFMGKVDFDYEIIVVDDGSKDETKEVVEEFGRECVRYLTYGENRGKGGAVNFGIQQAIGKWKLFSDADNSTPIRELSKLWPFRDDFEIVIGSRYLKTSDIKRHQPTFRMIASRLGNLLTRILILPGIADTQCGFKMFEANAAEVIFPRQTIWRWGFDMEVLRIGREKKFKIKEVGVDWYDAEASKIQSKKVFFKTLGELFRIKWNSIWGVYRK